MVDVRFELTTTASQVLPTTPYVKALVRWATGKMLTNRLPKLSLITKPCCSFLLGFSTLPSA